MGWCSGDLICAQVWNEVREYISSQERAAVYAVIIGIFEDYDMDCWDSIGATKDGQAALKLMGRGTHDDSV